MVSSHPTEAASRGDTQIKITITQPSPSETKGDEAPVGGEVVKREPGGQITSTISGKRLPVTGESYSPIISCLGYMALGITVLLFFIKKERKERAHEAGN